MRAVHRHEMQQGTEDAEVSRITVTHLVNPYLDKGNDATEDSCEDGRHGFCGLVVLYIDSFPMHRATETVRREPQTHPDSVFSFRVSRNVVSLMHAVVDLN